MAVKVLQAPGPHPWLGDNRTDTPLTLAAWAAAAIDSEYAFQWSPPVQWRAGRPILFGRIGVGLGAGRDDEAARGCMGRQEAGVPHRMRPRTWPLGRGTRAARDAIKFSGSNSPWGVPSLKERFHSPPPPPPPPGPCPGRLSAARRGGRGPGIGPPVRAWRARLARRPPRS